jgi:hypothetical protein
MVNLALGLAASGRRISRRSSSTITFRSVGLRVGWKGRFVGLAVGRSVGLVNLDGRGESQCKVHRPGPLVTEWESCGPFQRLGPHRSASPLASEDRLQHCSPGAEVIDTADRVRAEQHEAKPSRDHLSTSHRSTSSLPPDALLGPHLNAQSVNTPYPGPHHSASSLPSASSLSEVGTWVPCLRECERFGNVWEVCVCVFGRGVCVKAQGTVESVPAVPARVEIVGREGGSVSYKGGARFRHEPRVCGTAPRQRGTGYRGPQFPNPARFGGVAQRDRPHWGDLGS